LEQASINLYWYRSRWFDGELAHFIQADSLIPDPGDPLAWDRYSYVGNNPINRIDPTGHTYCTFGACKKPKKDGSGGLTDVTSRSNNMQGKGIDSHTGARVEKAQFVYDEVVSLSGKTYLTMEEILTMISQKEFGICIGKDYDYSEEALGRQLFYWCGSDGRCQGDQLWQFLGSMHAWYGNDASELSARIGEMKGIETSNRILNQEPTWKTGWAYDRPFVFGNFSMFPEVKNFIAEGGRGQGAGRSWVLLTDLTDPYIVWSPEQRAYWKNLHENIIKEQTGED